MMPINQLYYLGFSHQTTPLSLRECLHCSLNELRAELDWLRCPVAVDDNGQLKAVREVVLLSTCNRLEIFAVMDPAVREVPALLLRALAAATNQAPAVLAPYATSARGWSAARHLFEVTAGLSSLVLGEPQIQGQVTRAFMAATDAGVIGPVLTALFRAAIRAGKRARTETAISQRPASISSVAVELAQSELAAWPDCHVLVVGLGEIGRLTLPALRARGIERISLVNRTRARAEELAPAHDATVYDWADLPTAVAAADVILVATGAETPLFNPANLGPMLTGRQGRPRLILDLAVPRNVAPAVGELPQVTLRDMDDLRDSLDEARAERQAAVPAVTAIIDAELDELQTVMQELMVRPVISGLHQKAEAIRQQEMERTLRHLGDVDPELLEQLQRFSRSLVNKLLHEPTLRLRQAAGDDEAADYTDAVRQLFGLVDEPAPVEVRR